MIHIQSKDLILLTGAGFTKNFGGFLSGEMWAQIFNDAEIQSDGDLRDLLQKDYDFESVYSAVVSSRMTEASKNIMKRAIEKSYKNLDDAIKNWVFNESNPYPVNWSCLNNLITLFNGSRDEKGFFFTLNQDLFMERQSSYHSPGSPRFSHEFYTLHGKELMPNEFVMLQGAGVEEKAEKDIDNHVGLVYIKLHGSYGWKSSDGSNQLVIGKNKTELIDKEPLLKWYLDLFQKVITERDKKLLIIGYGFGDQHINKILVNGVKKYGLKIYIISTQSIAELRTHFERGGTLYMRFQFFLDGLRGYFPYHLKEIFPADQSNTVYFDTIKESLMRN